jgi:hypothetical protein
LIVVVTDGGWCSVEATTQKRSARYARRWRAIRGRCKAHQGQGDAIKADRLNKMKATACDILVLCTEVGALVGIGVESARDSACKSPNSWRARSMKQAGIPVMRPSISNFGSQGTNGDATERNGDVPLH